MFWPLTVLSMALLWLLRRLYTLHKVPPTELVKALKIEIPRASKLSIDNITDAAVYLHWDLPSLSDQIVSFMLFVNGNEASALNGTDSHCCLTGLNPGTKYKIDLISINSKGFKAKSQSTYIRTKSKELQNHSNRILLENADNLYSFLTGKTESTFNVKKFLGAPGTSGDVRTARSRSNTVNSLKDADAENVIPSNASVQTTTALPDPRSIDDIEELRYYLESGQEELHTVLNQQTTALREFKELEMNLIQERNALRERKRLEDTNRQTTKNESKLLDDSRRRTELKKTKQEAALMSKRKAIEKMQSDLVSWNVKLEEFEKSKIEMENSESQLQDELDTDITRKKELVRKLQSELSKLEEEFKSTNQKKKQLEQAKPSYSKIFKKLSSGTYNTTGCISAEGLKSLETLKDLNLELHNSIQAEINEDTRLEAEWRAQQQREVNHCAKASQAYDILKTENANLKSGAWSPSNAGSFSPSGASAVPLSQSASYANSNSNTNLQFQPPASSLASTQNFKYFNNSSPSINSLSQHMASQAQQRTQSQQSSSFNQVSSLWSNFNTENTNTNSNKLSLSTNGVDLFNDPGIDSPSANHFLPANLIVDDLADFMYQESSQPHVPVQSNTPKSSSHFDYPLDSMTGGNGFSSINNSNGQMNFVTSTNQEFTLSPEFSIETPASPPQSFQNKDILSGSSSPSGAHINNELHTVLLGGPEMITNVNPASQDLDDSKDTHFNPFSPRRLSNVFNFGRNKNQESSQPPQPVQANPMKQQSKFFNNNLDGVKSNTSSFQDNFSFQRNGNGSSSSKFFSTFDTVWQGSNAGNIHNRNVSVNSTNSLEKDNDSWYRFHIKSPDLNSSPASPESTNDNLMIPVSLTETNKSSNTTSAKSLKSVKSVKSVVDSTNNNGGSPSFFKKKFPFVGNNEKSPTKVNSLHRSTSPSGEAIEEEISDDQQLHSLQTPKRLFSRSRKSSSSNIRKQSVSSSLEYEIESSGSIQSNSTNGRSIVRKLNIFGKGNKDANEDVIDENVEAERDLNDAK